MASSTDGYKENGAKNFQEWIEINKSRNHETLLDHLSSSSLSSSSSNELINQCGKSVLGGGGGKGKKVRFKKKLRRTKDYNLNYRNHYNDDRRNGNANSFCHLVKRFSIVGGFLTAITLIIVVVNIQAKLDILQSQLKLTNEQYHSLTLTLSTLKRKTEEHDNLIYSLSSNSSAYYNNTLTKQQPVIISDELSRNLSITSKTLKDLTSLPDRLTELASQVRKLSFDIALCSNRIEKLEEKVNHSSQSKDSSTSSFSSVYNRQ